jgi:hypothetical protein
MRASMSGATNQFRSEEDDMADPEKKLAKGRTSTLDRVREEKGLAELRDMSFEDLIAEAQDAGELLDAVQLGEGYHLLRGEDEKEKLVGQELAVLNYRDNPQGKFGVFFTLHIKTRFPIRFGEESYQHFIVNDGSSGIARQLLDLKRAGSTGVIHCRRGFRVSKDYEVVTREVDPDTGETIRKPVIDPGTGKPILGTTFYLDTSL